LQYVLLLTGDFLKCSTRSTSTKKNIHFM